MRANNWSILAVFVVASILLLGGFAAVAWTAPVSLSTTTAANTVSTSTISGEQIGAPVITPYIVELAEMQNSGTCNANYNADETVSELFRPDLVCPSCSNNNQCNICCFPNLGACFGLPGPGTCHCEG